MACDQQQAGKFSVNLPSTGRVRVPSHIDAGPCPHMKPSYSNFPYRIGICEEWAIRDEGGQLAMVKVGSDDVAELRRQGLPRGALISRMEEWQRPSSEATRGSLMEGSGMGTCAHCGSNFYEVHRSLTSSMTAGCRRYAWAVASAERQSASAVLPPQLIAEGARATASVLGAAPNSVERAKLGGWVTASADGIECGGGTQACCPGSRTRWRSGVPRSAACTCSTTQAGNDRSPVNTACGSRRVKPCITSRSSTAPAGR